jgi:hypothetical protein
MPGVHKIVPNHVLNGHMYSKTGKMCTFNAYFTSYLNSIGNTDKSSFSYEFAQKYLTKYVQDNRELIISADERYYEPTGEFMKLLLDHGRVEIKYIQNKVWAACIPLMSNEEMNYFNVATSGKYKRDYNLTNEMLAADTQSTD